jgi:nicotinamide-nucleotide amidase
MTEHALHTLAARLGEALCARGVLLATAESCTGGWVSKVVTDIPGSSSWFDCGFVVYNRNAKHCMLAVPLETIDQHGEVSEPVVRAMAEAVLAKSRAALSIAISGIAGPSGGSVDKPIGTVCFSWCLADTVAGMVKNTRVQTTTQHFDGDREDVRRQAVSHALQGALDLLEAH